MWWQERFQPDPEPSTDILGRAAIWFAFGKAGISPKSCGRTQSVGGLPPAIGRAI
jgi:hypothetical protein